MSADAPATALSSTFDLPPALAIDTAGDLKPWLHDLLQDAAGEPTLSLNAAYVSRLTTPGLQLLCAFERALTEQGRRLRIAAPSDIFTESCAQLGFSTHLQRWSA